MTSDRLDDVGAALESALGRPVARKVPLAEYSTYRLGGPAGLLVEAGSVRDLEAVASVVTATDVPVLVVGRGSNLLVADSGFPGIAVRLVGEFEEVAVSSERVRAGGGVALPVLARRAAAAGAAGIEFFVGIPGSVGGAVRMNAGGHGRETADVLVRAWTVDLADRAVEEERAPSSLDLAYRHSCLRGAEVVTGAEFAVTGDDPARCQTRIEEIVRWRREHQPGGSNAGSVFANPPGDSAGRLIDAAGLKGFRVGGAVVSEKHANFFQAEPSARAADVHDLIREVRRRVAERTGIELRPEITLIGFDDEPAGTRGAGT